jgi:hypothetical protein
LGGDVVANGMRCFDQVKDGIDEIAGLGPELSEAIANRDEEADTRKGAIQTIDEMCDGLQLAADLISKELSAGISEFNRVRQEKEEILRDYFERIALRFSEPSIRLLLHDGQVCVDLHKLGDRFEQPFSKKASKSMSLWQNVKILFSRSSHMLSVLHGFVEGELDYVRGFSFFLDEARDLADTATQIPWGDGLSLRAHGDGLVQVLRDKRVVLQGKLTEMRAAADLAIAALHEADTGKA